MLNYSVAELRYIATKFVRALLGVLKTTHHLTPETWKYVPQQDFGETSDVDWSLSVDDVNDFLCKKYQLTSEEILFINEKVQAMKDSADEQERM